MVMCESYKMKCECGKKQAEIFFGKMLLDEKALKRLYCPECSGEDLIETTDKVLDNGWVLELDMEHIRSYTSTFGVTPEDLTACWIFDYGYVTWVGITPDDSENRNRERAEIQELAKKDMHAYLKAMREWGIEREKRFTREGWRKMQ